MLLDPVRHPRWTETVPVRSSCLEKKSGLDGKQMGSLRARAPRYPRRRRTPSSKLSLNADITSWAKHHLPNQQLNNIFFFAVCILALTVQEWIECSGYGCFFVAMNRCSSKWVNLYFKHSSVQRVARRRVHVSMLSSSHRFVSGDLLLTQTASRFYVANWSRKKKLFFFLQWWWLV